VKNRRDLTVTEKCVAFVLADYHNNVKSASWPSLDTISHDSSLPARSVSRILKRLEAKGVIFRKSGGGKGRISSYSFPAISPLPGADFDDRQQAIPFPEKASPNPDPRTGFTAPNPDRNPDRNPDPGDIAIRNEPVYMNGVTGKPVRAPASATCARTMVEILGLTNLPATLQSIEAGIVAEAAYRGCSVEDAAGAITPMALEDRRRGIAVDRWYFQDTKWRTRGKPDKGQQYAERCDEEREALRQLQSRAASA
jgi:hypothetical protein